MPVVSHLRVQQGYRPFTNPRRAMLGAIGGSLGVDSLPYGLLAVKFADGTSGFFDSTDGTYYDSQGNDVTGYVKNFAVFGSPQVQFLGPASKASIDAANGVDAASSATGNTRSIPAAPAPTTPSIGIASGSYIAYTGQWQTTTTKNANDIIQAVIAALPAQGLRVTNLSTSAGMLANTKILGVAEAGQTFSVSLQLQVTGSGFAQPGDVASIVDHFVYASSGKMPLSSSAGSQGTSGGTPPSPGATDLTTWLESNALLIGIGVVAAIVLPKVL